MANSPDKIDRLNDQQAAKLASLSIKRNASQDELTRAILDMQLRQWCVEQANVFCEHSKHNLAPSALTEVAKSTFDFVTAPLREQQ